MSGVRTDVSPPLCFGRPLWGFAVSGVRTGDIYDRCERLGCNVEYPCLGQLGKYQNGLVERRIKEIGRIARCSKETSGLPDSASSYLLHAVDILNALPIKANPTDGTTDVTGTFLAVPEILRLPTVDGFIPCLRFLLLCNMDDDHVDKTNKNVTASPCVYLCNAGHFKS